MTAAKRMEENIKKGKDRQKREERKTQRKTGRERKKKLK
jgi:hypothetical protein